MNVSRTGCQRVQRISIAVFLVLFVTGMGAICWQGCATGHRPDDRRPAQSSFASVEGRHIEVDQFGHGTQTVLVMGGIHGDEPASVVLSRALVQHLRALPITRFSQRVVVMPEVNPDGLAKHTRYNAHQIDLNRNFPTRNFGTGDHVGRHNSGRVAASEPETQAIMQVVAQYQPVLIISCHAPLGCINYDGPAEVMARRMARWDHFPVVKQLDRRTPGSLGTYYGKERGIPVITLELLPEQNQWATHGQAILEAIGVTADAK